MKILVVDDNSDDRRLLRYIIERKGHEVVEAEDGLEGLRMAKIHGPDVIISDALMPLMDGYQLLREIKDDETLKSIPFIFYSATYRAEKDVALAISLGAEAYIIKPNQPGALWEEVEIILQEAKKEKIITPELIEEDEEYLKRYSQTVAIKLEEKVRELEKVLAQRRQAEEGLRRSSEEIQDLYNNAPCGYHSLDKDGVFMRINDTELAWLGYSREALIGKRKFSEVLTSKSLAALKERCPDFEKDGWLQDLELEMVRKDGSVMPVLLNATCMRDADGNYLMNRCTVYDITERKKTEEFIRNVLESVDEGFIVVDRDYTVISANKAYCVQAGAPVGRIVGRHCYECAHRIDEPCFNRGEECAVKHAFETGEPHAAVHTHYDAEGSASYFEVKAYPMRDSAGKVISAIEITNDVTEQRKLEDQLRQSQKMEAVGLLAGGIAHDFNNILTAIISYVNLLQMKMGNEDPQRVFADEILGAAERAARLTQGLLTFSRKQVISPQPVDLNETIMITARLLLPLIGEDIAVKTVLSEKPLTVVSDAGQIEQVLMNLATNARDAMPRGGTLTIETAPADMDEAFVRTHGYGSPGKYALLTVTDTGEGMDSQTRERIFEPFFTTKEFGKGTGLGLATVYGILNQHNGYVNVHSEPGKGTTFRIYLPLAERAPGKTETVRLPFPEGGAETILLADDDAEARRAIRAVLEEFGYVVIEAVNGEDAVCRFIEQRDTVRLLILDVIMPEKSGREVFEEIRKVRPDIRTIFSSGYAEEMIREQAILEKGTAFLLKPASPGELLRKVREVLDR